MLLLTSTSRVHLRKSSHRSPAEHSRRRHLKAQESPHTTAKQKEEEKEKKIGRGHQPRQAADREKKSLHLEKAPLVGKPAGAEKELQGVRGERCSWSAEGRAKGLHAGSALRSRTPPG